MDRSSISALHKSTFEERQANLTYLRKLYMLYALYMIIAVLWTSFLLTNTDAAQWVLDNWMIALIVGIVTFLIFLVCMFASFSRNPPINFLLYLLFAVGFAYSVGYLSVKDKSRLFWFGLCALTAIAVAFALYSVFSQTYLQSLMGFLFVIGAVLLVAILFIIFTDISFLGLLLVGLASIIFGFYLNNNVRRTVRGGLYNSLKEDPASGSVRLWGEVALVFCRLVEMISGMCRR